MSASINSVPERSAGGVGWNEIDENPSLLEVYANNAYSAIRGGHLCEFCGKVTRTSIGLRRHFYSCRTMPIRLVGIFLDASASGKLRRRSSIPSVGSDNAEPRQKASAPLMPPNKSLISGGEDSSTNDLVRCSKCGSQVKRKNVKRHFRKAHTRQRILEREAPDDRRSERIGAYSRCPVCSYYVLTPKMSGHREHCGQPQKQKREPWLLFTGGFETSRRRH